MRGGIVLGLVLLGGALGPAVEGARADALATTGTPSGLTGTSARLNGVAMALVPGQEAEFQYGTTSAYGQATSPLPLGTGLTLLAEQVSDLRPGTTYHYRLVVLNGGTLFGTGSDSSFTTPASASGSTAPAAGRAALTTRRLLVTGGKLTVRLTCRGAAGSTCRGLLAVSLPAPRRAGASLVCAGEAIQVASAEQPSAVRMPVSRGCLTRLRAARQHHLAGTLQALLTGQKAALRLPVMLRLRRP